MSKAQMEFLKTLWGLLEVIIELMQMVRVYTALILETISSGFSEFPNSMRPPCTTMPWTIWPALVVLWGVCWMFQAAENAAVNLEFQLSSEELEQILFPNSNALINSPGVPSWANQGISTGVLSEHVDYLLNSFDGLNGVEFDPMLPSVESYEAPDNISEHTAPYLEEEFPLNFPSSINLLEPAPSVDIYSVTASSSQISTAPLHGVEGSVIGLTSGANPQLIETAQSHKASTTYTRPEKPPLNSNGEMTCNHSDCSNKNLIFTNFGKWSKHQNKHDRPFKCSVASCDRIEGFTSKGDQERHERSVHKALSSEVGTQSGTSLKPPYFCDEPDCTRGPGSNNGFPRKDNLKDHVQRIHGRDLAPSRVSIRGGEGRNGITILANQGLEQHQMGFWAPIPRNQKRTATQAAGTSDEETTARKKSRQEDQESNNNMERSPREDALAEQVEKLKKELEEAQKRNEKTQKENEVLISIIDRLTQGPR
ncbi:hypothetical protein F5882DRAFT_419559 [Hyaloscypha sp. PMI_1271]|nr:hypothetical protein F5882DRAFT_419559 [Hyaloscypha sp. PMI_1271]